MPRVKLDYARIMLRIPKALHDQLVTSARNQSHSLNSDIIKRLERSFTQDGKILNVERLDEIIRAVIAQMNADALADHQREPSEE